LLGEKVNKIFYIFSYYMNRSKLVSFAVTLLVMGVFLAVALFRSSNSSDYAGNCDIGNYKIVKIGNQTWMAENLNCHASGGKCYDNDITNCAKYGRLYSWSTAMALPSICDSIFCTNRINVPHRGICPSGWHIPSNAEWDALYRFADSSNGTDSLYDSYIAGKHLKATEGWFNCSSSGSGKAYSCEDSFDFSALPSGIGNFDGYFSNGGSYGFWWSIDEYNRLNAYGRGMTYNSERAGWFNRSKSYLFSVRCLQD
jgi:uncharacterized protein (TIGR02145 family)